MLKLLQLFLQIKGKDSLWEDCALSDHKSPLSVTVYLSKAHIAILNGQHLTVAEEKFSRETFYLQQCKSILEKTGYVQKYDQ